MAEENQEEEQWENVENELGKTIRWTEEPKSIKEGEKTVFIGTTVKGIYENKREGVGEHGSTVYEIRTAEHGKVNVWDTTVLNDLMKKVSVGSEVQITMTGSQKPKTGGKEYMKFDVKKRGAKMESVAADDEMPPM